MKGVVGAFRTTIQRQFDTQGGYLGRTWAKLSPAYERWKVNHYPGELILSRSGSMKAAFTTGLKAIVFGGKTVTLQFEMGQGIRYWKSHQYGDQSRNLPKRAIIPDVNSRVFISGVKQLLAAYVAGRQ